MRGGVMYELGQLLIEHLEDTLDDIADIVCPLGEDGKLKESPRERERERRREDSIFTMKEQKYQLEVLIKEIL